MHAMTVFMTIINKKKGFTLIELSVVIVIIGLIVAGIVGGQNLVKQAKLKTIASEFQKLEIAMNTFQLEYNHLPGDIPNANSYWTGCNSGASASECNGDGNRKIEWTNGSDSDRESVRVYQHLSLAGLLNGNYSGVYAPPYGSNIWYVSTTGLGAFGIQTLNNNNVFKTGTTVEEKNLMIWFGSNKATIWDSALTVSHAQNLDKKMDDGVANKGKFIGQSGLDVASGTCSAHGSVDGGADYNSSNLSSDTKYCLLHKFIK